MKIKFNDAGIVGAKDISLFWSKVDESDVRAYLVGSGGSRVWEVNPLLVEFSNFSQSQYLSVSLDLNDSFKELESKSKRLENLTKIFIAYRRVADPVSIGAYQISEEFIEPFALICECDSDICVVNVAEYPLCLNIVDKKEQTEIIFSSVESYELIWDRKI